MSIVADSALNDLCPVPTRAAMCHPYREEEIKAVKVGDWSSCPTADGR